MVKRSPERGEAFAGALAKSLDQVGDVVAEGVEVRRARFTDVQIAELVCRFPLHGLILAVGTA